MCPLGLIPGALRQNRLRNHRQYTTFFVSQVRLQIIKLKFSEINSKII